MPRIDYFKCNKSNTHSFLYKSYTSKTYGQFDCRVFTSGCRREFQVNIRTHGRISLCRPATEFSWSWVFLMLLWIPGVAMNTGWIPYSLFNHHSKLWIYILSIYPVLDIPLWSLYIVIVFGLLDFPLVRRFIASLWLHSLEESTL